MTNHNLMSETT